MKLLTCNTFAMQHTVHCGIRQSLIDFNEGCNDTSLRPAEMQYVTGAHECLIARTYTLSKVLQIEETAKINYTG